jgi:hypothetical protein
MAVIGPFIAASACVPVLNAGTPQPVQVVPGEVSPGDIALLRVAKGGFKGIEGLSVTINNRPATVTGVVDANTIQVVVPDLPPGEFSVVMSRKGDVIAQGTATIAHAPMERIFLRLEGDSVSFVKTRPYNGAYEPEAGRGRRISYDLVTRNGALLYTAAIRHPATDTFEVYGAADPHRPRHLPATEPYSFAIKIPYMREAAILRIYDAPDGVDLDTAQGRAARRLIGEIEMGGRR